MRRLRARLHLDRRRRRGRTRPAGGPGRRRLRRDRPAAHAQRSRRLEEGAPRATHRAGRANQSERAILGNRRSLGRGDRTHQHLSRQHPRDGARAGGAPTAAALSVDRRRSNSLVRRRAAAGHQRRREMRDGRRRLDRRKGPSRRVAGRTRPGFSAVRFRRAQRLSTPQHQAALSKHGPCEHHRRHFLRVQNALSLFEFEATRATLVEA